MERFSDAPTTHQERPVSHNGGGSRGRSGFEGIIADTVLAVGDSVHDAPTPEAWAARVDHPGSPFATGELSEVSLGDELSAATPDNDSLETDEADTGLDDGEQEMESAAESFGTYLRRLREEKALTQEEVTNRLGQASPLRLRQIETGERHPPQGAIARIMEVIGVDPEEIADTIPGYVKEREQVLAKHDIGTPSEEVKPSSERELPLNRTILRHLTEQGVAPDQLLPQQKPGRRNRDPELVRTMLDALTGDESYEEIAARTGCSSVTVRRYETAIMAQVRRNPEVHALIPQEMADKPSHTIGRFTGEGYLGVGSQLREAARVKHVRIADVAGHLGVAVETIMRLHNGSHKPPPWVVAEYAKFLGMNSDGVEATTLQYTKKEYEPRWEQARQRQVASSFEESPKEQ